MRVLQWDAVAMSWCMKLKLPTLKVTQRSASGVVHRNVPRGERTADYNKSSVLEEVSEPTPDPSVDSIGDDPSLYAVNQKVCTLAWASIRQGLLKAAVENNAMPINQICIMCPNKAVCRCVQCFPRAFYCHGCFKEAHMKVNLFHAGEMWQVSYNISIVLLLG